MTQSGIVISDLHLFARRANEDQIQKALQAKADHSGFLVLNGDIFDFHWSRYHTLDKTIEAAKEWLQDLQKKLPHSSIHYIMGNHDCYAPWGEALDTIRHDRFSWSPTHVKIGSSLFLHGDLPVAGQDPFHRTLPTTHVRQTAYNIMDNLYEGITRLHIHRPIGLLHKPRNCVPRIHKVLESHGKDHLEGVTDIYFGHTHEPFSEYHYKGLRFHNTGSAIRHLRMNMLTVNHA